MKNEHLEIKKKLLSPREFAELLGVSRKAVNDAINAGRLDKSITTEPNGYHKIDVPLGVLDWFNNADPTKDRDGRYASQGGKPALNEEDLSYFEARRVKECYKAYQTKIEYLAKLGSLVPKDAASKLIFEKGRMFRDKLLVLPDTMSPRLANQESHKIRILLRDELEKALTVLSEGDEVA